MPFDGTGFDGRGKTLAKMDRVIDLLSEERRWCKRQLQTPDGRRCIVGAMVAADAAVELKRPILLAIEQVTGHRARIEAFNDDPRTTHALVVKVLHRARANIASEASPATDRGVRPWAALYQMLR